MKRTVIVLSLLVTSAAISACSARVDTPDATVHGDGFRIDIDGNRSNHCPPGHAKKNWC